MSFFATQPFSVGSACNSISGFETFIKKRAEIPSFLSHRPVGKQLIRIASRADIGDGNIFSGLSGLRRIRRFASQRSSCLFPIMPLFDGRTIALQSSLENAS